MTDDRSRGSAVLGAPTHHLTSMRTIAVLGVVYLPLLAIYYAASDTAQNVMFPAVAFASFTMIVVGIVRNRPARLLPWVFAAAGVFCLACGETLFSVYDVTGGAPFPSFADVLWLSGHTLLAVWVGLHLRARFSRHDRDAYLDALLITMSCLVLIWIFVIQPSLELSELTWVQRAVSVAYPALDMFMVFMIILLVIGAGARSTALQLLLVAFTIEVGANSVFGYLQLNGGYESGSPIDAAWLLVYLLWGAVALRPSMRTFDRPQLSRHAAVMGRPRLILMLGALLVSPALFVASFRATNDVWSIWFICGVWAVMSSLVMYRISGLVKSLAGALDELHAASRVQTEFFAMAAHELRNPITSILGFADTLVHRWRTLDDAEQLQYAEVIRSQSERLTRLITDMLAVSQIEEGTFAVGRSQDVVANIVEHAVAESGAEGVDIRGSLRTRIECDVDQVEQILVNLLTNAHKYGEAPIEVSVTVDDDGLVTVVRDHGPGVSDDFVPMMFDRFTRDRAAAGAAQPGTGLGLAIVQLLTQQQGGSVHYRTADGGGAEFEVRLPHALPELA